MSVRKGGHGGLNVRLWGNGGAPCRPDVSAHRYRKAAPNDDMLKRLVRWRSSSVRQEARAVVASPSYDAGWCGLAAPPK